MPPRLHPPAIATDTEDAAVLTPVRVMVLWKAANTRELFWLRTKRDLFGGERKMPYLWEAAQMCIFSPSMWRAVNKTLGIAHENSRHKGSYSHCCLSLLINLPLPFSWKLSCSFTDIGGFGGSVGMKALARRSLPKPKYDRAQRTSKTSRATVVDKMLCSPRGCSMINTAFALLLNHLPYWTA